MDCSECARPAVIDQPYAAAHRCGEHFRRHVEHRVRQEFRRQLPRFGRGTLGVALSGGKDSAVALALTHAQYATRPDVRIVAISIDEGIEGYRAPTLTAGAELTKRLGIERRVVRAEEALGTTTDRAARELPTTVPCSFCGVWRRRLLNEAARDVGARALVLGFNLDDLAQTVLMNIARGAPERLERMAPHRATRPGFVPRIAPLAQVPEREVLLYALLAGLPYDGGECPYATRAQRNVFRTALWQLEEAVPGTRQALLKTRERWIERPRDGAPLEAPRRCAQCGEPSSSLRCRACAYLSTLARSDAAPAEVRS